MDKQTIAKRNPMGVRKLNLTDTTDVAQIFEDLEESASINQRDLISYLDVADKTLRNWRASKVPDSQTGKLVRLHRLKEVVDAALNNSISKTLIRQLLVAPLDPNDHLQRSIVDMIKTEPDSAFFPQMVSMLVENFRNRQNANGHYSLSNEDFDKLVEDLQSDREPTEAVKRARARFVSLRNKASK